MSSLTPKLEHLDDPYVLQLIERLARIDDLVEELRESGNEPLADAIQDLLK